MKCEWFLCAGLAAALCATGCGSYDEDDYITLVPVEGVVTENGKPLDGAKITFVPAPSNKVTTTGVDLSGPDGSFSAKYRNRPGLAPGKYKVLVGKLSSVPGKTIPKELEGQTYMAKLGGLLKDDGPEVYTDLKKTPLSVEVSEKGEKGLAFDLKRGSTPGAGRPKANPPPIPVLAK